MAQGLSFEARLIAAAGESAVKAAKQLLKNDRLRQAVRDEEGTLKAIFEEPSGFVRTTVRPGSPALAVCSCRGARCEESASLCEHAAALLMHAGRFRVPEGVPELHEEKATYGGLKHTGLKALAEECPEEPSAKLYMVAESAFPHVPSKWENAVLSVRLRNAKREYLGNLNNLRHLFFEHSLAVTLKLGDFSLADQQIIRFLAINAEAKDSNLLLNSEQTAEFFHCLGGFDRFTRNGRRLIIHCEAAAQAVILRHGRERMPGIRFANALLATPSAKIITGRAGCWIGREGEYFWIPAESDVGFLRNFFRLGAWKADDDGAPEFAARSQLPVCPWKGGEEPKVQPAAVLLEGELRNERLELDLTMIYRNAAFPPDGGRLQPGNDGRFWKRDELLELRLANDCAMMHLEGDFRSGRLAVAGTEAVGAFLDQGIPRWQKLLPELALGTRLSRLSSGGSGLPALRLRCDLASRADDGSSFTLAYCWYAGEGTIGVKELNAAVKRDAGYVQLHNGMMAVLPQDSASRIRQLFAALPHWNETDGTVTVPAIQLPYFAHLTEPWKEAMPGVLQTRLGALNGGPEMEETPGMTLHATLRGYQREGVAWMRTMLANGFNVVLADEMGLGKTVQTLAVLVRFRRQDRPAPALVIAPASLVVNWQREAGRFVPGFKVTGLTGANKDEILPHLNDFDLIVTSYAQARRDIEALKKVRFGFVVLDEAQHIKNPGTANAQCCKALKSDHRIVLTGTPLENSPEDLWSIFDFLHPGYLGSFASFRKNSAGIAADPALARDLAARVAPFIKRRCKSEVAPELPPKQEHTYCCSMNEAQRELYESIRREGKAQLAELDKKRGTAGHFEILTTLLRLRQVCCHPALLGKAGEGIESAKFELLKELVLEHLDSHHRMLLFSQFTSLLGVVRGWLDAEGIRYNYLDGATRNRQEQVDAFNQSPDVPLFLLSLKAGGTGLNLTAADTVIIYDPWWNPAVELQAADRTHRIGQTKTVNALKLLVHDSIEEKILELKRKKQQIFDNLVTASSQQAEKFTMEELRFLLN